MPDLIQIILFTHFFSKNIGKMLKINPIKLKLKFKIMISDIAKSINKFINKEKFKSLRLKG